MNVFVITSPFQYLCANEARMAYKTKINILVYVEQLSERGIKNMNQILDETLWDEIIKIPRTQRTFRIPRVIKKIKSKKSHVERIFFSDYHSWRTNIFIKNFPDSKLVYFDDGSATLIEHENLIKPQKTYTRKRLFNDIMIYLQGLKPPRNVPYNNNLEIFTVFNIENDNCYIRKNEMLGIRETLNSRACFDETADIGFIGESNINARPDCIKLEDYIIELKKIIDNTQKSIIYFPHRMESKEVRETVSKLERIKYHDSTFPIELEIAKSQIKLSEIIGYSSTALYTLSIIYSEIPITTLQPNSMASCSVALETNDIIKKQLN